MVRLDVIIIFCVSNTLFLSIFGYNIQTNNLVGLLIVLFALETENNAQHVTVSCCSSLVVLPSQGEHHHGQELLESRLHLTSELSTQLASNHDGQAVGQELRHNKNIRNIKGRSFFNMNKKS